MKLPNFRTAREAAWHFRQGGVEQVKTWQLRRQAETGLRTPENIRGAEGGWRGRGGRRRLSFRPQPYPEQTPRRRDITAAVLLDDFSRAAFSYEWNTLVLGRKTWREQLSSAEVHLLFVEAAWNGNGGAWQYQLTGEAGPKEDFVQLVQWCRAQGIPTVFWNKEDPPHYGDFLPAARLFDYVFTTDSNMVPRYKKDLGHDGVGVLPFAAQPAIHNPVRPRHGWHSRDVAFAGMYFSHKYPERREQMDLILGGALDAASRFPTGLEIFSRQLDGDTRYQFPAPYAASVVGSLRYDQMLTAYKAYKVFLNVNSVIDSPSMCARRIFEITASGTPVLTAPSAAVGEFFPADEVPVAATRSQAAQLTRLLVESPEYNARVTHKAQRRIWNEHTYAHRAELVLSAVLPERLVPVSLPSVSVLVSSIRPNRVEEVFATVGAQAGVDTELVLVTHGFELSTDRVRSLQSSYGVSAVTVLPAAAELALGSCLNLGVRACSGDVVTKMDDDDYYAPNYLRDQLHALHYSGATIVGKQAHYMYFSETNASVLRFAHKEHRFTRLVMGPTMMGRRETFVQLPFRDVARGEDTAFLADVHAAAGTVYSADRYNYFQIRGGDGHTWQVSDDELLSSGRVVFFGSPTEQVTL
ncbi:MAG: glycosyltransferase [Micrococcaceae bacterium]|nr:glycosyltransferase [Micrococcaceae bacterium]